MANLVAAGVRDAVISPGSRSTPLVWAATRAAGLRCHCIIDERSAGFYALGQARISGLPSLLICTSGSALSHYFPAVIEARESSLPLIVLSADRPFELQHCGAHQTIDQTRIFGAYAPYHELGTPVDDREALLGVRRTAWQAVAASLTAPRGAVHLNFRAKKPLEPLLGAPFIERPEPGSSRLLLDDETRAPGAAELEWLLAALRESECPLLICGASSLRDTPSPELVRRFARLSGCVVCPESVSQLRFRLGAEVEPGVLCDTYDWLLTSSAARKSLAPDFALQLGASPVSAALERLIGDRALALRYAICAESGWPDPLHKSAQMLRARSGPLLEAACLALESAERRPRSSRVEAWRSAQRVAAAVVHEQLRGSFGEPSAVAAVCDALPPGSVFAVGNSLPPRLLDRYCPVSARGISVCSQRGASGIEGAVAGVLGAASQVDGPITLLLGDISFLHDIGSLWAAQPAHTHAEAARHPIVIVVLNNGGGRIFEQLPIAAYPGVDLHFWTTPHQLKLRAAAELYGVPFASADRASTLNEALDAAYDRPGVSLIEVVIDPASALESQRNTAAELEPRLAALFRSEAS